MSAATEFAPDVYIPPRARPCAQPTAAVITLHRPAEQSVAPSLRLTQRGVIALGLAVAALAVGLLWVARLSAPGAGGERVQRPATVTVHEGDTLWSIATRIAPDSDPRAEVAELQRRNDLSGVELRAGEVLRTD